MAQYKIKEVKPAKEPLRRLKGRYYVVYVADNGEPLSTSETFPTLSGAEHNAERQRELAGDADIVYPDGSTWGR